MPPSEYIALRWSSVDWLSNQVTVERSRVVGITREETKTEAGRRVIDLRNGAIRALRAQKEHTALENDLIFQDARSGTRWDNTGILSHRWNGILCKAGVRQSVLYQTRHTFASTLLSTTSMPCT